MTTMSDLPEDLVEEILSRVPITSLRTLRFTCKRWNVLSKDQSLTKKPYDKSALYRAFVVIMMADFRDRLTSVNLHEIQNHKDGLVDLSIKQVGKLNQVDISKIFHCDGLLLCVSRDNTRLVVWNPYLGQTRWFQTSKYLHMIERYALGYDNNNHHKILTFVDWYEVSVTLPTFEYEIYDFESDSRKVIRVIPDWYIPDYRQGLSLKGNTYFVARERLEAQDVDERLGEFLLCFDFTRERFGPRMRLPFRSCINDSVILSTVREEKLAVLCKRRDRNEREIWITTKIEANAVLWRKFLKVDMIPYINSYHFLYQSFIVDEKKKVAVICDKDRENETNYTAYMVGEDGCYKEVDLGESKYLYLACSYVPSPVQIQLGLRARGKRKERDY